MPTLGEYWQTFTDDPGAYLGEFFSDYGKEAKAEAEAVGNFVVETPGQIWDYSVDTASAVGSSIGDAVGSVASIPGQAIGAVANTAKWTGLILLGVVLLVLFLTYKLFSKGIDKAPDTIKASAKMTEATGKAVGNLGPLALL